MTTGERAIIENTWHMQDYKDDPPPEDKKKLAFGRRNELNKKLEMEQKTRSPSPTRAEVQLEGVELVCTSKIRVGQKVVSTTVRTYRTVDLAEEQDEEVFASGEPLFDELMDDIQLIEDQMGDMS